MFGLWQVRFTTNQRAHGLKGVFERVIILLRGTRDSAIVDKCRDPRFTLTDIDIGVWDVMFFEPLDHMNSQLTRR